MAQIVAVSKATKNVLTATNPNDFIFHSDYNTFKIIATGTFSDTILAYSDETFTVAHNLNYAPLCHAFIKFDDFSQIVLPDEGQYTSIFGDNQTQYVRFTRVETDSTNVRIRIYNDFLYSYDRNFTVRYFIFEVPL